MIANASTHLAGRKRKEVFFRFVCTLAVLIGILMLALLLWGSVRDGVGRINLSFLTNNISRRAKDAGIIAGLYGTLWIIGITALVAMPLGIAAAIYLEEIAKRSRWTKMIELNIANLAGVPSIIYGLLGLAVFVRYFALGRSVMAGSLTMALLVLPTIIITAQEALRAVPRSLREGSLALGSTVWQTIWRQTLPAAVPGIMTGMILAVSRAIGETAPIVMIAALYISDIPKGPGDSFTALPMLIYYWTGLPTSGLNGNFAENASAGIIVLLAVLLVLNGFAIYLRGRFRKRLGT